MATVFRSSDTTRRMKVTSPGKTVRQRRPPGRPVKYPALLLVQNKHRFYFATIPVNDLFDTAASLHDAMRIREKDD
jgi:hypothetical protein